MISNVYNYDKVFFRDITITLLDKLENSIGWENRFSNNKIIDVDVPFTYSMLGDERFLMDAFNDDVVSDNRKTEMNTDVIPRGSIILSSINVEKDKFTNPNVPIKITKVDKESNSLVSYSNNVRSIPLRLDYEVEILLESEIDTFKCQESILDTLWIFNLMYFNYNGIRIDCGVELTNDTSTIIKRESTTLTSDKEGTRLKFNLNVYCYYPGFIKDDKTTEIRNLSRKKVKWYNILKSYGGIE